MMSSPPSKSSRPRFGSSIQTKLVAALVLLTVGPLLLFGVLITDRTGRLLNERISEELRVEVETAAETLEVSLAGARRDLLSMAGFLQRRLRPTMSATDWQRLETQLLQTLRQEKGAYQLRLLDPSGRVLLGIDKRNGSLFALPPRSRPTTGRETTSPRP